MATEHLEIMARGECPICAASVVPAVRVEEAELLACPECRSVLVVDRIETSRIVLSEAPQIEEDWGQ